MRVRYQMVNQSGWSAECDLPLKKAKQRYNELKENGWCMWCELIGEEEENYMDVLESFDKSKEAQMIALIMRGFM